MQMRTVQRPKPTIYLHHLWPKVLDSSSCCSCSLAQYNFQHISYIIYHIQWYAGLLAALPGFQLWPSLHWRRSRRSPRRDWRKGTFVVALVQRIANLRASRGGWKVGWVYEESGTSRCDVSFSDHFLCPYAAFDHLLGAPDMLCICRVCLYLLKLKLCEFIRCQRRTQPKRSSRYQVRQRGGRFDVLLLPCNCWCGISCFLRCHFACGKSSHCCDSFCLVLPS